MILKGEARRATEMLAGRSIKLVARHREGEVMIEFEDGARFYADSAGPLELSITLPDADDY